MPVEESAMGREGRNGAVQPERGALEPWRVEDRSKRQEERDAERGEEGGQEARAGPGRGEVAQRRDGARSQGTQATEPGPGARERTNAHTRHRQAPRAGVAEGSSGHPEGAPGERGAPTRAQARNTREGQ